MRNRKASGKRQNIDGDLLESLRNARHDLQQVQRDVQRHNELGAQLQERLIGANAVMAHCVKTAQRVMGLPLNAELDLEQGVAIWPDKEG